MTTAVALTVARGALAGAPLEPSAPDAEELLRSELADPQYAEAQPSWFDLLSQSVVDWFVGLFDSGVSGPPGLGILVVALLIAGLVAVAILLVGLPARRARRARDTELFGASDARSARDMRRDADAAAGRGDYAAAIADRYRAIARALDERTIVTVHPGTTAHGFARLAARAYTAEGDALTTAADAFDSVRYLGRAGTEQQYQQVADLDGRIAAAPSPVVKAATPSEVPR